MKRIDAYLSSLGYCSRSEAKKFLKMNEVCINENRVFNTSLKGNHKDITVNGEKLDDEKLLILLHKPNGYICSHNDSGKLIYSLLPQRWQNRNPKISTIGRLDIDTTGAILLTDDGELNHKLSSPKNSISKIYEATLENPLSSDIIDIFSSGEIILKGEEKPLKAAKLDILNQNLARLEIVEGKYHQVKRMFAYVGNKVLKLHRVSFDNFKIDDLKEGEYKLIPIKRI
ncbi:pseudouridine synthase [Aliarcobacter lanthieri]|uniref:pseudouridine synthase n=1 Tax=Aliarcobacter lanthieri TaxID=1355374 RepID=UPI00047C0B0E|nr:pseudouridine synthase [Aliarcobacter lanthieri]QKF59314.1 RsuA-like pseudouridine synthase [Aliarcobacter lanthieri]